MLSRSPLRTAGTLLGALVLSLTMAESAAAQIQKPKNAVKDLKAKSKLALQETKARLVNPKNVLGAQLNGFTKAVANGAPYGDAQLLELFMEMEVVQAEVAVAVQEGTASIRDHASLLLTDLRGTADPGEGVYPLNFYRGDQGHLDNFHFQMREVIRKSLKLTRNRLRRLTRNMRVNTSIDITAVVGPYLALPSLTAAPGVVSPVNDMLTVDLLMAWSDSFFTGDGAVCAAGSGNAGAGDVTVQVFDAYGVVAATEVSSLDGDDRWQVHFSELQEGNYSVVATQGDSKALNEIGVR